jgi:imidazolonepropionase-like amidohydrolase
VLLTARRLFTSVTPVPLSDQVLEIDERGRIVSIRPRAQIGASVELVDFGDATLLPGMIDIHQHLCFDATVDPVPQVQADDDATLLVRMRRAARRALSAGITTVRDLGDRNYSSLVLRDLIGAGAEVGPRILAAGPPITTPNGHCWFLGGEVEPGDVARAVRERVDRGVDVIKIMASGGNMTPTVAPHESQFGQIDIAVALREAHAAGLRLAVHAHGVDAVRAALAVGADSIEHCTLFTVDGVANDENQLEHLAISRSVVSMTAAATPGSEPPFPAIRQRIAAILTNHRQIYRRGARVVCSSDAGVGPTKPHDVLPHGVVTFLPMLGMSNAEAITNVTAAAAAACGISDRTGTLEPGKDADILVVAGDPVTDLSALHDVLAVYVRGQSA